MSRLENVELAGLRLGMNINQVINILPKIETMPLGEFGDLLATFMPSHDQPNDSSFAHIYQIHIQFMLEQAVEIQVDYIDTLHQWENSVDKFSSHLAKAQGFPDEWQYKEAPEYLNKTHQDEHIRIEIETKFLKSSNDRSWASSIVYKVSLTAYKKMEEVYIQHRQIVQARNEKKKLEEEKLKKNFKF